jgi:four helix bundle protein
MRDYTKYEVWQEAHALTLLVYKEIIPSMPKSEQYELTSQLKRAVYSIPLNVAEGCGRNSDKDFVHFLDIALGSLHETEYCFLLAKDLDYLRLEKFDKVNLMINQLKAKLINLIKTIRK